MFRILQKKHVSTFLILLSIVVSAPQVFAHSHPVSMDPAANAITATPEKVTMHFSGDLEPKFSSITVSSANGHVVNKAPSVVSTGDAKLMTIALPKLPAGVYTVDWIAVSVDSHRMQGSYSFTVK